MTILHDSRSNFLQRPGVHRVIIVCQPIEGSQKISDKLNDLLIAAVAS
jgi:hypothetical protein